MSLWVRIPLGDVMRFEPIIVKKSTQPNFYGFSWVQLGGHFLAPTEHPKIACVIYTLYILSCFFICEFLQKCTFLFKNLAYNSKPSYKQNYLIIGNNWLFSYFVLVYGYALIK